MAVVELTTIEEIETALKGNEAYIKVSTTSCGPCKMMNPLFDFISEKATHGNFYAITADTVDPEVGRYVREKLNVNSVPVFFVYKNENQLSRVDGAFPKTQLVQKLGVELKED